MTAIQFAIIRAAAQQAAAINETGIHTKDVVMRFKIARQIAEQCEPDAHLELWAEIWRAEGKIAE